MFRWISRLRPRTEEIDEELRYHLAMLAGERSEEGASPSEAGSFARRKLGNPTLIREITRETWGWNWPERLLQDLRFAARMFRKNPGFTLVAVLSLSIGIGANTALFTATDAFLWKQLPVHEPERLVRVAAARPDGRLRGVPAPFIQELQQGSPFSAIFSSSWDGLSLSVGDKAERIMGEVDSPNCFSALGVKPFLGRVFTEDGTWKPEAVLAYHFWQRRFHADPGVIGSTIRINTYPFTVVGVTPENFFGTIVGLSPELRIPLMPPGQSLDQIEMVSHVRTRMLSAIGRLKPGVTPAQAEAAADARFQRFQETSGRRPEGSNQQHLRLLPAARGASDVRATFAQPLTVLFAAVGLLLLVACATVANLLLARAGARRREIAMRIAIGAGRGRLLRQLLTESVLLSSVSAAAGILLSLWMTRALFAYLPQTHQLIVLDLRPDYRALAFTLCIAVLTGVLFGIVPALQATRGQLADALKNDSAASIGSGRRGRWDFRRFLVSAQVALSVLLVIGAALLVRSLENLKQTDYGFKPGNVVLFTMKPQREVYKPDQVRHIAAEVSRRVNDLPGVTSAAWAESGPLDSRGVGSSAVSLAGGETAHPLADAVSPGFFKTAGIPLMRGRDFSISDQPASLPVAIVDEILAATLFHGQDPIGRTILVGERERKPHRIVGMVRRARYDDLRRAAAPALYLSLTQEVPYMPTLHVKTSVPDVTSLVAAVRRQFEEVDKDVPVFNVKTMAARVDDALARERLLAALCGVFGLIGLMLAAIGLYGVIAYDVARRTRELGMRMALGAGRAAIGRAVLKECAILTALGIAVGWPAAMAATRLLSGLLYGVTAQDARTGIGCTAVIAAVGICAGLVPAWRASRIDPMIALREE